MDDENKNLNLTAVLYYSAVLQSAAVILLAY